MERSSKAREIVRTLVSKPVPTVVQKEQVPFPSTPKMQYEHIIFKRRIFLYTLVKPKHLYLYLYLCICVVYYVYVRKKYNITTIFPDS